MVGIYCGQGKPEAITEFLSDFVRELSALSQFGIKVNGAHLAVSIFGLVCDGPAKSYVLGGKGHYAYFECVKCEVKGERINNRTCFPDITAPLRIHHGDDRSSNFTTVSPLAQLHLNFVKDVPLHYMHPVCLGVMKKLILIWLRGDIRVFRLCNRDVEIINQRLNMCQIHSN